MTGRVEQIGDATLYLGDCRDILPTLGWADAIITDPPYSANTHKMAKTNKGASHGVKLVTFDALDDDGFRSVVDACFEACGGWIVMTCDYRHAALCYQHEGFVRLGAWVKPNPVPQISGDRPGQGFETVLIMHGATQKKSWNRGGGSGVWTYPVTNGADVPTQKPLSLIAAFVSDFTRPMHKVVDPFMGAGTTGVACVQQGRRFVGIEALPEHFEVACRRIEAAHKQPRLFSEPVQKPIQEKFI